MRKAREAIEKFNNIHKISRYILLYGITLSIIMLLFGIILSVENMKAFDYFLWQDIVRAGEDAARCFALSVGFALVVDGISRRSN